MIAVHQDYAHHVATEPTERIGPWCIYAVEPPEFAWCPTVGTAALAALRVEHADWTPEDPTPRPLPSPAPPDEPIH